jgi:hypothetical protein
MKPSAIGANLPQRGIAGEAFSHAETDLGAIRRKREVVCDTREAHQLPRRASVVIGEIKIGGPSVIRADFEKPSRFICVEPTTRGRGVGERDQKVAKAKISKNTIAPTIHSREWFFVGTAGVRPTLRVTAALPESVSRLSRFRSARSSGIFLEQLVDDAFQFRRQLRLQPYRRSWSFVQDGVENQRGSGAWKGVVPGG